MYEVLLLSSLTISNLPCRSLMSLIDFLDHEASPTEYVTFDAVIGLALLCKLAEPQCITEQTNTPNPRVYTPYESKPMWVFSRFSSQVVVIIARTITRLCFTRTNWMRVRVDTNDVAQTGHHLSHANRHPRP